MVTRGMRVAAAASALSLLTALTVSTASAQAPSSSTLVRAGAYITGDFAGVGPLQFDQATGFVYVASLNNTSNQIELVRYDAAKLDGTGQPTKLHQVIVPSPAGAFPRDIAIDSVNNRLYIVDNQNPPNVFKFDISAPGATPAFQGQQPAVDVVDAVSFGATQLLLNPSTNNLFVITDEGAVGSIIRIPTNSTGQLNLPADGAANLPTGLDSGIIETATNQILVGGDDLIVYKVIVSDIFNTTNFNLIIENTLNGGTFQNKPVPAVSDDGSIIAGELTVAEKFGNSFVFGTGNLFGVPSHLIRGATIGSRAEAPNGVNPLQAKKATSPAGLDLGLMGIVAAAKNEAQNLIYLIDNSTPARVGVADANSITILNSIALQANPVVENQGFINSADVLTSAVTANNEGVLHTGMLFPINRVVVSNVTANKVVLPPPTTTPTTPTTAPPVIIPPTTSTLFVDSPNYPQADPTSNADLLGSWQKAEQKNGKFKGKLLVTNSFVGEVSQVGVQFFVSDDNQLQTSETLNVADTATVKKIKAKKPGSGKGKKVTPKALKKGSVPLSGKFVIAWIDSNNSVKERDERNNVVPTPNVL